MAIAKRLKKCTRTYIATRMQRLSRNATCEATFTVIRYACTQIIQQCQCISSYFEFTKSQLRSVGYTLCGNQSSTRQGAVNHNMTTHLNGFLDLLCAYNVSVNGELDSEDSACSDLCDYPCTENLYDVGISTSGQWPDPCYQQAFYKDYIADRWFSDKFAVYKNISEMVDRGVLSLVS
jgi:hypothetical protein